MLSREDLWQRTRNIDRFFVKSFPHYQLPLREPIQFKAPSQAKWDYLHKYALTEGGVLDKLLHDLRNALAMGEAGQERIAQLVEQLQGVPDMQGDQVRELLPVYRRDMDADAAMRWAGQLFGALQRRIYSLHPDRRRQQPAVGEERKPLLMLLEDDAAMSAQLAPLFADHFDVKPFHSGAEAMRELEVGGIFYRALVADLELLDDSGRFDQPVQGIEVLEYAEREHSQIARRVVTQLGRRGVQELLDMNVQHILYKAHLKNGADDLFMEFLDELLNEVEERRTLQAMPGPNSTFWSDVSAEADKKTGLKKKGGGFRRFYYKVRLEEEARFKAMWAGIERKVRLVLAGDPDLRVDTTLGNTGDAKDFLETRTHEFNADLLARLLTHRMIVLATYPDKAEVVYRDENNKGASYWHKDFWKEVQKDKIEKGTLTADQKRFLYFTGFESIGQSATKNEEAGAASKFTLRYGQLFREEVDLLKKFPELHKDRFDDFYLQHEDLCNTLNPILGFIAEHLRTETRRPAFAQKYPAELENAMTMGKAFAKDVLTALSKEAQLSFVSSARSLVFDYLTEYRDGRRGQDFGEEGTPDYRGLPNDLKELLDQCLRTL
ncbi:MAG: hypothetical protein IPP83_13530 [Flavobacteriales bacterium]|nr:hypothetical protein [Flavobacteriales bacterium]